MTADNFAQAMSIFLRRQPFRPFTITLMSGRRLGVDHPEAVFTRDGGGVAFFFAPGDVPVLFDHEGVGEFIGDLTDQPANGA